MNNISVVINCYNSELFLKECIESVLNQSFQNFELIIWNNCSIDNTDTVVKEFTDKRIRYFVSNKFTNLSKARNLALEKAKYDWIAFVDSDDIWEQNKLSKQLKIISTKKNEVGLVYTDFHYINDKSEIINKKSYTKFYDKKILNSLLKENYICFSSIIFNKKFLKKKPFCEVLQNAEDYYLILNLANNSSVYYVKEKLTKYRLHKNNLSNSQGLRSFAEWQYILSKLSYINIFYYKKLVKRKFFFFKLKNKIKSIYDVFNNRK